MALIGICFRFGHWIRPPGEAAGLRGVIVLSMFGFSNLYRLWTTIRRMDIKVILYFLQASIVVWEMFVCIWLDEQLCNAKLSLFFEQLAAGVPVFDTVNQMRSLWTCLHANGCGWSVVDFKQVFFLVCAKK